MTDAGAVPASENGGARSYYGQPVIKEPVWTPEIPFYFFTGGLAGASAGLAYLSELRGNGVLARRAWTAALAGATASPALLISDLGVPRRFLNMLRMLKVTSPMSVGTWILSGASPAIGVSTINAWTGRLSPLARAAKPAAAMLGLPLSTYTAALVADTAVPVWHEARGPLAFVFAGGSAASAGALAVAATPVRHAGPARRLAVAGAAAELVGTQVMERKLGDLGEPYHEGAAGRFAKLAKGLTGAGGAIVAARAERSRRDAVLGGALLAAGALAERWSIFKAGFQSASDPKYVVGPQRQRIEEGTTRGSVRRAQAAGPPASREAGSPSTSD